MDYSHEDLAGAIWVNLGEIPGNGIDDDGNGYIDDVFGWNFYDNNNNVLPDAEDGHGTHGAGTIGAVSNNGIGISGIVPGGRVKIMVLKALGGSEGGGKSCLLYTSIIFIWKRSQGCIKAGTVTGKDRRQGHDEERVFFKKRRTFFSG